MSMEHAMAWGLVGVCVGIFVVGCIVIAAVVLERIADRTRSSVLRDSMKGRRR